MLKGKVLAAASNATPPAPPTPTVPPMVFPGTTSDYYRRSSALTGIAASATGVFSAWVRIDGRAANAKTILHMSQGAQTIVDIGIQSNLFQVNVQDGGGSNLFIFRAVTALNIAASGAWIHFLASWNTNAAAGAKQGWIAINGINQPLTILSDTAPAFNVGYNLADTITAGANQGGGNQHQGAIGQLYFYGGQLQSLATQANIDKFIGTSGAPLDYGAAGATPLGSSPHIFLNNSTVATWGNNLGTAGNLTLVGTGITTSSTSPSDSVYGNVFLTSDSSSITHYTYNNAGASSILSYIYPLIFTALPGTNNAAGISKDGLVGLIAPIGSGTNLIGIRRMNNAFVTTTNAPAIAGPASNLGGTSLSSDGTYAAVAHSTSPFISVYSRSGNTWTKLANPATLPNGTGVSAAITADGQFIAVTQNVGAAPNLLWYQRSGSTLTKLTDPTQPALSLLGCAWDPTSTYLAVGANSSPFFHWYSRSGTTLTKLSNPTTLPAGNVRHMAWMNDTYVVAALNPSPYLVFYKRTGSTLDALTAPATMPTSAVIGISASNDGNYVTVHYSASPYTITYFRSGDTFTALTTPSVLPGITASSASMS